MRASARILGQPLGLTAQEINYALKEAGFLSGEPVAYSVTEKGAKYATGQLHGRGTGGYLTYNPSWMTTTWDDSVVAALSLSEAKKRLIRQAVSDARRTARAARSAAAVVADTSSRGAGAARGGGGYALTPAGRMLLAAVAAHGIFKAVPLVQKVWSEKAAPGLKNLKDRVQPKPDAGEEAGTDDGA